MAFKRTIQTLNGVGQTGREMVRLSTQYNDDVKAFDSMTLEQFFNLIKSLEYRPDPPGQEHLSRPGASLKKTAVYRDCDDKAIIMGAFLFRKKIPFRFVGVSKKPDGRLHHVLVEALMRGSPRMIDATYPHNELFKQVDYTAYKPISNWVQ